MKKLIIFILIFTQTTLLNGACLDVDMNNDNSTGLKDAIIILQLLTDRASDVIVPQADTLDTNDDSKIGLAENIYLLQYIAGIRSSKSPHCATLYGTEIYVFNGLPVYNGWGKDLVYPVNAMKSEFSMKKKVA